MPTYTPSQWGRESVGAWIDSFGLVVNNDWLGVVFDLTSAGDGVNAPIFGITFTLSLTFTTVTQNPASKDFGSLYFVNQYAPADFSTSNLPSTLTDSLLLAEVETGDFVVGASSLTLTVDGFASQMNNVGKLRSVMSHGDWSGKVALALGPISGATGSVTFDGAASTFTTVETEFLTGWDGYPIGRGRSVTCGRSGLPALSEELVEDGYTPGLYVKRRWWDPEDGREQDTEMPDTEGEPGDEVPNF